VSDRPRRFLPAGLRVVRLFAIGAQNGGAGFSQSDGCTFESLGNNLVSGNTAGHTEGTITTVSGI
jgi:hypothetical protein